MISKLATFALMVVCGIFLTAADFSPEYVARGRYLMNSIVACGNCHSPTENAIPLSGKELSGSKILLEGVPFTAYGYNLTPDPSTNVSKWSDAELVRAIREGVRPDGSLIGPVMPFIQYRGMADVDALSIVAYLRQISPIANTLPKSEYKNPLPANYGPPIRERVRVPDRNDQLRYGEYLANSLGHCISCHSPMVNGKVDLTQAGAGGRQFKGTWGTSIARNLTPDDSGLKNWTDAEIERAIRHGISKGGGQLLPPMPFYYYKNIAQNDMKALIAYLRTLKPQPFGGRPAPPKS